MRWHVLAAIGVVLLMTALVIVQTVTDPTGAPIPLKTWLNPASAARILLGMRKKTFVPSLDRVLFAKDHAIFQNPQSPKKVFSITDPVPVDQEFVLAPNGKFAAYRSDKTEVVIMLIDGTAPIIFPNTGAEIVNIIHWNLDSSALYLAIRNKTWSIVRTDFNGGLTTLADGIQFPHDLLTKSYAPLNQYVLYPECSKTCHFSIIALADPKQKVTIAATGDAVEGDIVSNLNFAFFSEQDNLIGYWTTEDTRPFRFLVTGHRGITDEPRPALLQSVHLDANRARLLTYTGFAATFKRMLFTTNPENSDLQEFFSYSTTQPSLTILKSVKNPTSTVLMLNNEGTYEAQDVLYSTQNPRWSYPLKKNQSPIVVR